MKFRKFIRSPGVFFRDFLVKRYPIVLNEIGCSVSEESFVIRCEERLNKLTANDIPVDVVFTWVDDADPKWQQRFAAAQSQGNVEDRGRFALDKARFANHDELRYSLMSIQKFMPWVNKIYLVTDRQRPSWLGVDSLVQVVDHTEIIEPQYLPTFNSHVIEACIHRIPGLSQSFIYFNDDVFAARSLHKNHFFRGNGLASLFLANKSLDAMRVRGTQTPTLSASMRGRALLHHIYGIEVDVPLVHTYVPLQKKFFELVWSRHEPDIRKFMGNRFRGNSDLNLATFLVPWTAYLEGGAVPATDVCYYFNVRSAASRIHWQSLITNRLVSPPHSFCANDFNDNQPEGMKSDLCLLLDRFFDEIR